MQTNEADTWKCSEIAVYELNLRLLVIIGLFKMYDRNCIDVQYTWVQLFEARLD